jgi:hypothetical protein
MNLRCSVFIFLSLCTLLFANSATSEERRYYATQETVGSSTKYLNPSNCAYYESLGDINGSTYESVYICGGFPTQYEFKNPITCERVRTRDPGYRRKRNMYDITVDCGDPAAVDQAIEQLENEADRPRCPYGFYDDFGSCKDVDECVIGTSIDLLTNSCVQDDCSVGEFAGAGNLCETCPPGTDCYQEPPDPCLINNTAPGCPGHIPDPEPDPDPNDPFQPDPDFPDGGSGSGSTDSPGVTVTPGGDSNPDDSGEPNEPNDSGIFDDRPDPSAGDDFSIPSTPPTTGLPTNSNGDTSLDGLIQWLSEFTAPDDAIGTEASTQTSDLRGEVAERSVNVDLSQMAQIDSSGFLAESCPADVQVSTSFGNITISMSPICDLASLLKPLLIALVTYLVYMRVFYALVEIAD